MGWQGNKATYVIKHTANTVDYVAEAAHSIRVAYGNLDSFDAEVQRMLDMEVTARDFTGIVIPEVIGSRPQDTGRSQTVWDNKFDQIVGHYNADHNEAITDTAWGAVNALNEFETWSVKPRGGRELWEAQFTKLLTDNFDLTKRAVNLFATV
jgi:hypothetical protein